MEVLKVGTVGELDLIMPLVKKVHRFAGIDKYVSLTGYMTWLAMNLPNQNFAIWYKANEDGKATDFIVVQVQTRALQLECAIVDAYMGSVDTELSEEMYDFIEAWAKDHNCDYLSCYSNRPDALSKKYGFDKFGTVMIRAI